MTRPIDKPIPPLPPSNGKQLEALVEARHLAVQAMMDATATERHGRDLRRTANRLLRRYEELLFEYNSEYHNS